MLLKEYLRDKEAGINPETPCKIFPDDDDSKTPRGRRDHPSFVAPKLLNYFYTSTPYDIKLGP